VAERARPTEDDRIAALQIVLRGIAAGSDVHDLEDAIAPLHPRYDTFPSEVLLELAADALEVGGVDRAHPIEFSGIRERFLPEREFRGKTDHAKSHYALRVVPQIRAGVAPDFFDDVGWWREMDLWRWALYALVIYVRAVAQHSGQPAIEICRRLAEIHDVALDAPDA
jgi:hypothetical protein